VGAECVSAKRQADAGNLLYLSKRREGVYTIRAKGKIFGK
jgi:hypothetical protein